MQSAVLAMIGPTVCHTLVSCQNNSSYIGSCHVIFTEG